MKNLSLEDRREAEKEMRKLHRQRTPEIVKKMEQERGFEMNQFTCLRKDPKRDKKSKRELIIQECLTKGWPLIRCFIFGVF